MLDPVLSFMDFGALVTSTVALWQQQFRAVILL